MPFDAMCEVKALAYAMKDELLRGNLHSFGKLLDYGWQSKKRIAARSRIRRLMSFMKKL